MRNLAEITHTPGPWHVDPHAVGDIECGHGTIAIAINRATGFRVPAGNEAVADITKDEAHANARLMAAAPDMLKALEAIAAVLNLDDENSHVCDDREGAISRAYGTARAAIAKATSKGAA
jgi:hypothetical protein